jgi:hypothetical protein
MGGGGGGLIDLTYEPPRYAGSGEPVTAESRSYFTQQETSFRQERIAIYESEKTKGTAPMDILAKLLGAHESQPARYRAMMYGPLSAWPALVNA